MHAQVANYSVVETCMIIIIFFISGVVLKTEELVNAIHHPGPLLWGLVAILGITPCVGFITIRLPLTPPEFAVGARPCPALFSPLLRLRQACHMCTCDGGPHTRLCSPAAEAHVTTV